jgi:hypothetical protein
MPQSADLSSSGRDDRVLEAVINLPTQSLIGAQQERGGRRDVDFLRRLQIQDELEFSRLFDRQLGWLNGSGLVKLSRCHFHRMT